MEMIENKKEVIITGDFNINLLKINEKEIVCEFLKSLISHSYFPKITFPTRFSRTTVTGTLIDTFFCKLTRTTFDITSGILTKSFSDHQPYFIFLNCETTNKKPPNKCIQIRSHNETSFINVEKDLQSSNVIPLMDNNVTSNTNDNYNILLEEMKKAIDKHIPLKTVKFAKYRPKKETWITSGILKSIRYKDKLYKQLKMINPLIPQYNILKTNRTILKRNIRLAKNMHYANNIMFYKSKNDSKKIWKQINDLISSRNQYKQHNYFKTNDSILTVHTDIANNFNSYFTNIWPNLANNIHNVNPINPLSYLNTLDNNVFHFQDLDESIAELIIDNFPSKNSCGYDGISLRLLKFCKLTIIKPLTLIIRQVLNTGIFPEKLKIAKVIPIFKKGDEELFSNYRPISILPAISKIIEKVIYQQIYSFFQQNELFYGSQYDFRTNHSTEHAALELADRILYSLDLNETPLSIFLDLSKAFDTLDHNILLNKLKHYGIRGEALTFF